MRIQVFIATLFVVFLSLPQFAHAQLSADSTADIRIDADDAVNRNGVTILTGQVDIRQADARLLADKVEIFSDRNSGTSLITSDAITRMVATGNFFYITPDQEVRGDKGIYTADTESFVVTGDVILLQDDSVVTGLSLIHI